MPIIFRCPNCKKKLSVSSRRAGLEVACPECTSRIVIPQVEPTVKPPGSELAEPRVSAEAPGEKVSVSPPIAEQSPPGEPALDSSALVGPASGVSTTAEESKQLEPQSAVAESTQTGHKPRKRKSEPFVRRAPERNAWLADGDEEEPFKIEKRGMDDDALDMTPMVDVTFLLLIFFMITASFAVQKSMQTTPPEPEEEGVSQNVSQEDVEEESVIVEIDGENNLRVDDVPVASVGELVDVLSAKRASENKGELLIEAHAQCSHGMVVAVTDAGMDADMQRIRRTTTKGDD